MNDLSFHNLTALPVISSDRNVLALFRTHGKSVVWERVLPGPVSNVVDRLIHGSFADRRFTWKLDNTYLFADVTPDRIIIWRQKPKTGDATSLSKIFSGRNAEPLVKDFEERIRDMSQLLSEPLITILFYTRVAWLPKRFHVDKRSALLNYTDPSTQYGPREDFRSLDQSMFKCVNRSRLSTLPIGSVAYFNDQIPHRTYSSVFLGGLRLFMGMLPYRYRLIKFTSNN